jgi:UDP-N-acetylmuramate--alanine ligase
MNAQQHYHLVGIAGVGMSALAQAILGQGCMVSGSDRYLDKGESSEVLRKLEKLGVQLFPQDGSAITAETSGLVISTAIESDNPEIAAATRLQVPVIHRAEMLARLTTGKRCMAVTGTSGKSTVTGMIGWILEQLGADPTIVNGAAVLNWCNERDIGNTRCGKSDLWIIEADESDRSLMQYHPDWAVITNISKDHFELQETVGLFAKFRGQVRKEILDGAEILKDFKPELSAGKADFRYKDVGFHVSLPGRHNAENALCAVAMCELLGFGLKEIGGALASFRGIQRRLEIVGTARGVTVIDDYAHNPAKIRAAFEALTPYHKRMIAIWRPHGFKPLTSMMEELVNMFAEVCRPSDRLHILPVYDAGGTADRTINADALTDKLQARNVPARFVSDQAKLVALVSGDARSGDVVVTMGARDPDLPVLARALLSAINSIRPLQG